MKISYNWLKKYIDINLLVETVSQKLTDCGLEVESVEKFESVKGGLEGVVTGEVKTCIKHPDADRLHITTVDIGKDECLNIVCGAPNVEAGQKVIVAQVGTQLIIKDQPFTINKVKIRGVLSEGMICAEDELGIGISHAGIMVLDPSVPIGMTAREYFNITEDDVFEIGITPNRADATSHIGVARDLAAVLHAEGIRNIDLKMPDISGFTPGKRVNKVSIIIENPELCPRYTGLYISGVNIKESPAWLKNYLSAIGLRPINNIVDITNFVLFETGQPLHAFDADKITGNKVIVKTLKKGTKFTTLDGVERELTGEELMICNEAEGMVIAGVFGGEKSGVTVQTKNIFLESACFNPQSIRKTSKHHLLYTDASFRYERCSDPEITVFAIKRAAILISELAGGEIESSVIDAHPLPFRRRSIDIRFENVDRLIGKMIDRKLIVHILEWLEMKVDHVTDEGFTVMVPSNKPDITREADIIEEILRIYGYNRVEMPGNVRTSLTYSPKPDKEKIKNVISDMLSSTGFYEIMNNSLTNSRYYEKFPFLNTKGLVSLLNPISKDLNLMRQTLLFGGLETIAYNINHKISDLKLYEFGNVYFHLNGNPTGQIEEKFSEKERLTVFITGNDRPENWSYASEKVDFYTIKSVVFRIMKRLGIPYKDLNLKEISNDLFAYGLLSESVGESTLAFGLLDNSFNKYFDIKQEIYYAEFDLDYFIHHQSDYNILYKELTRYPEVRRDLALLVDKKVSFSEIEQLTYKTDNKLIRDINLFDIFEGDKIEPGKKSYAVCFILQDREKTLTDNEINKVMQKLMLAFEKELGAVIR